MVRVMTEDDQFDDERIDRRIQRHKSDSFKKYKQRKRNALIEVLIVYLSPSVFAIFYGFTRMGDKPIEYFQSNRFLSIPNVTGDELGFWVGIKNAMFLPSNSILMYASNTDATVFYSLEESTSYTLGVVCTFLFIGWCYRLLSE